jgi:hypothetical protein
MVTIYTYQPNAMDFVEVIENHDGTALQVHVINLDREERGYGATWLERAQVEELWQALGYWLGRNT